MRRCAVSGFRIFSLLVNHSAHQLGYRDAEFSGAAFQPFHLGVSEDDGLARAHKHLYNTS